MDINSQTKTDNTLTDMFDILLKRKKLVGVIVAVVIIVFMITLSFSSPSNQEKDSIEARDSSANSYLDAEGKPGPTHTPDLKEAINEAEKAADEYNAIQEEVSYDYPWLKKFPLVTDRYYVYFDTDKRVFAADIFLASGDNENQIKEEIQKQILEITKVPTENFQFEWSIKSR